jgi:hypothetical protein
MSITVAFLAPHTGRHAAVVIPIAAMASRFLRWLPRPSAAEGGRADPVPPRGAALLQDEQPEARTYQRPDGAITVEPDGSVTVRPVNGRNLGTQPRQYLPADTLDRRKPMVDRQPWQTMGQPVLPAPGPRGVPDPGDGLGPQVPIVRRYLDEMPGGMR